MSLRGPSARLFVAVDPPPQVRAALTAWARAAVRGPRSTPPAPMSGAWPRGDKRGPRRSSTPGALRILDADLLHVTICFLGECPLQQVDSIADEIAACDRPPVELSLGAPLWLPPRRPRALAVELHDDRGTLASIHAEVLARLATKAEANADSGQVSRSPRGGGGSRGRRFRPHVTVARMRPGDSPHERSLPPTPACTFAPSELVLYRSWLSPEGASYERLSSCPLGQ